MPLFGSSDWSGVGSNPGTQDWANIGDDWDTSGGSGSGSGGGFFNWLSNNKSDIQSALKGGASLTGGSGSGSSSSSGSGMRTDVSAQASLHPGSAASLGDLFQQLLQRRLATQSGSGSSRSGGLLGM